MRVDSDGNGIRDEIDVKRTEVDEEFKRGTIEIQENRLEETIRSNKANEEIKRDKPVKTVTGKNK